MDKVFIIAEVGINGNGDMNIVKKLIDGAKEAGCDAVKFQKRTIDVVYTKEELDKPRESPYGTTNREQKMGLEFTKEDYDWIDGYCKEIGIEWFASAWDTGSQDFIFQYALKYNKIAAAMLTDRDFVTKVAKEGKYTFISTGMSDDRQIGEVVTIFQENNCPFELMHCNSTYPMPKEDANLQSIPYLKNHFGCDVGYSGHEAGIIISCAAVAMGATSIERHITLDKTSWGSDHAASIECPHGLIKLVKGIRELEMALGSGEVCLTKSELSTRKKLRG